MAYGFDLLDHNTISNSCMLTRVRGIYEDNVQGNIGLRITRAHPEDGGDLISPYILPSSRAPASF